MNSGPSAPAMISAVSSAPSAAGHRQQLSSNSKKGPSLRRSCQLASGPCPPPKAPSVAAPWIPSRIYPGRRFALVTAVLCIRKCFRLPPPGMPMAAISARRSENDCKRTAGAPLDCQGAPGQCTTARLLSGNWSQKRQRNRVLTSLARNRRSTIGKTRHLIIRSRLPLFRRPVRLSPQVQPVVRLNKALRICGPLQKGS